MEKLKMINEFKEFAFKGNLIDMAVGIIIGGAFGTVMKSLVDDIFMPILGVITGGIDFSDKYVALSKRDEVAGMSLEKAEETGAALLTYGNFISAFIAFILVALAVFLVIVKLLGSITKGDEEPEEEEAEPEPSEEVKLLTEIRDALKK